MSDNVIAFPGAGNANEPKVDLARVQIGAQRIDHGNINDTYHGEILLEDGSVVLAYLKDLDARQLANELLVAGLGRALNLPMPRVYLAVAGAGVMPINHAPVAADGTAFVLASQDANVPSLKQFYDPTDQTVYRSILKKVSMWSEVDALYCIDTWCANVDRNIGNILVDGSSFWLIDHGQCFSGPAWVSAALNPSEPYINKIVHWLTPEISDTDKLLIAKAAATRALVPETVLDSAVVLSQARRFLTPEDQAAVTSFIKDRRPYLANMTAAALGVLVA